MEGNHAAPRQHCSALAEGIQKREDGAGGEGTGTSPEGRGHHTLKCLQSALPLTEARIGVLRNCTPCSNTLRALLRVVLPTRSCQGTAGAPKEMSFCSLLPCSPRLF